MKQKGLSSHDQVVEVESRCRRHGPSLCTEGCEGW